MTVLSDLQQIREAYGLATVQSLVAQCSPAYVKMLVWSEKDGTIKAKPRKPLSDLAHSKVLKVFTSLGGRFAKNHNGECWYEIAQPKPVTLSFEVYEKEA